MVVQDLFAKGYVGFIFGEAGSKKTWLLIDMSINLSNGIDVFNGIEVEQSKVLLFEGDTPDPMIRERLKQLGGRLNDEYFQYVNRYTADQKGIDISLSSKKGRKYIEKCIETFRPDIVIFDTLISFIDADESKQDEMKKIVDALENMRRIIIAIFWYVITQESENQGKKRGKLDQSDLIGSSVLNRLASVILAVDKGKKRNKAF
jgi:RecA-family ATPase